MRSKLGFVIPVIYFVYVIGGGLGLWGTAYVAGKAISSVKNVWNPEDKEKKAALAWQSELSKQISDFSALVQAYQQKDTAQQQAWTAFEAEMKAKDARYTIINFDVAEGISYIEQDKVPSSNEVKALEVLNQGYANMDKLTPEQQKQLDADKLAMKANFDAQMAVKQKELDDAKTAQAQEHTEKVSAQTQVTQLQTKVNTLETVNQQDQIKEKSYADQLSEWASTHANLEERVGQATIWIGILAAIVLLLLHFMHVNAIKHAGAIQVLNTHLSNALGTPDPTPVAPTPAPVPVAPVTPVSTPSK